MCKRWRWVIPASIPGQVVKGAGGGLTNQFGEAGGHGLPPQSHQTWLENPYEKWSCECCEWENHLSILYTVSISISISISIYGDVPANTALVTSWHHFFWCPRRARQRSWKLGEGAAGMWTCWSPGAKMSMSELSTRETFLLSSKGKRRANWRWRSSKMRLVEKMWSGIGHRWICWKGMDFCRFVVANMFGFFTIFRGDDLLLKVARIWQERRWAAIAAGDGSHARGQRVGMEESHAEGRTTACEAGWGIWRATCKDIGDHWCPSGIKHGNGKSLSKMEVWNVLTRKPSKGQWGIFRQTMFDYRRVNLRLRTW